MKQTTAAKSTMCIFQVLKEQVILYKKALVIFCTSFIFLTAFNSATAQTKTVSGVVKNEAGQVLAGATVKVKNSGTATKTDENGNYKISVPSDNAVLVITYVGLQAVERVVGSNSVVDVSFTVANTDLGEVVVVGYGTQKKATLTGSVATVNAKTFQDRGPVASPLAALQGQVPGVTVTRSSSQPGREGWNFQIRGASSINNTEPLVIVDGIPVPGLSALNSFNPLDIETVSFLKDAAAAIYGSRAAGGVVLVTTKRAKKGKAVIEYNGSVSQKKVGLLPTLTDAKGWGPMIDEARTGDGFLPTDIWVKYSRLFKYATANNIEIMTLAQAQAALTTLGLDPAGFFTDVKDFPFFGGTEQSVLWGDATSSEHQLSISSRGDNAGYRLSFGYLKDGSLLQPGNNSNKRYNIRLTHDYNFSPRLKLESNISLEKNNITQPYRLGDILNNGNQPGKPLSGLGLTGLPYIWGSGIGNASVNAIADFGGDNKELNTRLNTSFNLTYKISNDLKLVGAAGYYLLNTDYRSQENIIPWYDYAGTTNVSNLPARSSYQRGNKKEDNYSLNGYAEYSKKIGQDHDLKAMAGGQYERFEYNRFIGKTLDVITGVPPSLSLGTGDATSKTVAEAQFHTALAGYFGRFNYSYKSKYLFEANARYDGSSKFIQDSRWKFFYGFLAGWRISEENFMKDVNFISDLKLRASWGASGNQSGIGNYDYIQFLNVTSTTGQGSSGFPILGTAPVVRVSPTGTLVALDRTWEKLETSNIGLDFTVLKHRLAGSFDYFVKRNNNMLLNRTFPAVLGASAPQGNNGKLKTWGWDLGLNWSDKIGQLTYHIGGNISDNQNKLIDFGGQTIIGSGNRGYNTAVQGYAIGTYFGLVYAGRIQSQKELDDYKLLVPNNNIGIPSGTATAQANNRLALGDNMFKDVNGDGKLTFPEDAVDLGRDDPRFTYSLNGGVEWKGFDLGFIFQGIGERTIIRDGNWRIPAAVIFQAQNQAFVDKWWTATRTDAALPRISTTGTINNYNYFQSDWIAENGAYLRLKNLVVGYTLPRSITQRAKIDRLRIYFSGNDLWESSKIKDGWDPETTRSVGNTGDAENNNITTFSQRYPFYRYLTFGVNLTF
ncbi:MAG: TonB-dependent receptor [Rhizobacter sp.]|nr:TonB-dependent receptor [Ferruginibacter sp.]